MYILHSRNSENPARITKRIERKNSTTISATNVASGDTFLETVRTNSHVILMENPKNPTILRIPVPILVPINPLMESRNLLDDVTDVTKQDIYWWTVPILIL